MRSGSGACRTSAQEEARLSKVDVMKEGRGKQEIEDLKTCVRSRSVVSGSGSLLAQCQVRATNYLDRDMMYLADAEIDEGRSLLRGP